MISDSWCGGLSITVSLNGLLDAEIQKIYDISLDKKRWIT
jgi:hypothetical protein